MDRPVDNITYNLLQTLTSKLEAIEAYGVYMRDADQDIRGFFEECKRSDEQAVQRLLEMLGQRLPNATREAAGSSSR